MFYTYLWLREDGTPYYVGKGTGRRAYMHHGSTHRPKDKSRIFVQFWESEEKAFEIEKWYISLFGRKDLGTGILRNLTGGGEGQSGYSEDTRKKCGNGMRGKKRPPRNANWIAKFSAARMGHIVTEETREKLRKTHCVRGHSLVSENRSKHGTCLACKKLRNKGIPPGRKKQNRCNRGHDKLGRKECPVCKSERRAKGRRVVNPGILKPFCVRGHARTPDNVYNSGECKICAKEKSEIRRKSYV